MGSKGRELLFSAMSINKGYTKEVEILDGLSIFSDTEICSTSRIKEIT